MKDLRGYYKLNDSLRRLGLREVPELPQNIPPISLEDVTRLAFSLIDPVVFPYPSWMLRHELIDIEVFTDALRIAEKHRAALEKIENPILKFHYFGGAIDAVEMLNMEERGALPAGGGGPIPASLAR
jgi:hypothetical protein